MATTFPEAQNPAPQQEESQVDLRGYWRIIVRRRWLIVGSFLAVTLATAGYALRLPKIFTATATIEIEMAAPKVLGSGTVQDVAESGTPYWYSKEYYETQYNVLRSRAVAHRVARMVRTARDDKFL